MRVFEGLLEEATRKIEQQYINLPSAGSDEKLRERVYCYELYHQIRCNWPLNSRYFINGELDKRGHSVLRGFRETPDFLVHVPGVMENYAIIEVKHVRSAMSGFYKDLDTLERFYTDANYKTAILLVFGGRIKDSMLKDMKKKYTGEESRSTIEIWNHERSGVSAQVCETFRPSQFGATLFDES